MIFIVYITMSQHVTFTSTNFHCNMQSYVNSKIIFLYANLTYWNMCVCNTHTHQYIIYKFVFMKVYSSYE